MDGMRLALVPVEQGGVAAVRGAQGFVSPTFDADGGSPATQTRTASGGGSVGSSNMPSEPLRDGAVFIGWYTPRDGGGLPTGSRRHPPVREDNTL
jgi:hypothetical protein